jgi:glycosyltransferase involved in cell wall biosynthesis
MDTGQADALNRAFRLTTGEIMGYLNSDDLLLPGSLAYVSRFFADNASIDVIYGHRMLVDENDCLIGSWVMPSHSSRALRLADYIPQETLFWRRRIWNAVGESFATHLAYALDWELLLRFQTAGARIVRVPRFLGAFRVHPGQKSTHENSRRLTEEAELRRNLHARTLSEREVLIRLAPYLARHLAAHVRERLAAAMRTDDVTLWVTDDHEVPDAERQP